MSSNNESYDIEYLYELINEEIPVEEDVFTRKVQDLVDAGFLLSIINSQNDEVWYSGKPGLQFSDFSAIDDPMKKQILLQFVENPTIQFVLFNTQKGKSKIVQNELMEYARLSSCAIQVVSILMLDNDTTLGDQSVESLTKRMSDNGVQTELHYLCSNSKTNSTVGIICNAIDSYAAFPGEKPMPLIVALTNPKQLHKSIEVLNHIQQRHIARYPNLKYAIIWDEADKTYSWSRDRCVFNGMCVRHFTLDDMRGIYKNTFVTATEGSLIEDFPECANAHNFKIEKNEQDEQHYRTFHSSDAVIKILPPITNSKKNNDAFLEIFTENRSHFMSPIRLKNGTTGYRKTIIHSNAKCADMRALASTLNGFGCHCVVFNQTGLTVYPYGASAVPHRFKTKGCSFNELLFYTYTLFDLHTAPLFVVGRKKVDRGLGFHYAPRHYAEVVPKTLKFGKYNQIVTNGIDGLIWTDMFLGNIIIASSAVQKGGRLSGIIAHCPQYSGSLTFWTTKNTAEIIHNHCQMVDLTNRQNGCNTIEQAVVRAKREILPVAFVDAEEVAAAVDPRKTVPVIIGELTAADMVELAKRGDSRKVYLLSIIERRNNELFRDINENQYICEQVTAPETEGSYKKHITDVEKASVAGRQYVIDIKSSDKRNVYNCYIDNRRNRLIIVRWKGLVRG